MYQLVSELCVLFPGPNLTALLSHPPTEYYTILYNKWKWLFWDKLQSALIFL